MILSILIPTYNYDCRELVESLLNQLPADSEIIVGDDGSTDKEIVAKNRKINDWEHCRTWESSANMGRAAIRNQLAQLAKGKYLLFIDSDARVRHNDYLSIYPKAAASHTVVCGGTGNMKECPSPEKNLRYMYEVNAERKHTLHFRRQHPYDRFTTFNFLIDRKVFLSVLFDESVRQYGHEDTLFGLNLKQRGVDIWHIDNKLEHTGLEDAADYIHKSETALSTLSEMSEDMRLHAQISRLEIKLTNWHLSSLVIIFFQMFRKLMYKNLTSQNPKLWVLSLYRLGFYTLQRKKRKQDTLSVYLLII